MKSNELLAIPDDQSLRISSRGRIVRLARASLVVVAVGTLAQAAWMLAVDLVLLLFSLGDTSPILGVAHAILGDVLLDGARGAIASGIAAICLAVWGRIDEEGLPSLGRSALAFLVGYMIANGTILHEQPMTIGDWHGWRRLLISGYISGMLAASVLRGILRRTTR